MVCEVRTYINPQPPKPRRAESDAGSRQVHLAQRGHTLKEPLQIRPGLLPPLLMLFVIIASFAAALLYLPVAALDQRSPFTPMWVEFDPVEAIILAIPAIAACAVALCFPYSAPAIRLELLDTLARSKMSTTIWAIVAIVGILLLIVAKGELLLIAPNYLAFNVPRPVVSLTNVMAPVALIASGVVLARSRTLGALLSITIFVLLFAYGTRLLALAPLLIVLGYAVGGGKFRVSRWIGAMTLAVLILPVPLIARGAPEHGLIPYVGVVIQHYDLANGIRETLGNIGFTLPLMQYTARHASIPSEYMAISVNPLGTNAWEAISPIMRAHYFIPYSALGEWATFGPFASFLAVLTWALICRAAISEFSRMSHPLSFAFLIIALGLSALSLMYAMQYNTRSVTRILWIMLLLLFCSRVLSLLRRPQSATIRPNAGA